MPAGRAHERDVDLVEGLPDPAHGLHPAQRARFDRLAVLQRQGDELLVDQVDPGAVSTDAVAHALLDEAGSLRIGHQDAVRALDTGAPNVMVPNIRKTSDLVSDIAQVVALPMPAGTPVVASPAAKVSVPVLASAPSAGVPGSSRPKSSIRLISSRCRMEVISNRSVMMSYATKPAFCAASRIARGSTRRSRSRHRRR